MRQHAVNENKTIDYIASVIAERAKHKRDLSSCTISIPMQVRAVMLRSVLIAYSGADCAALLRFHFGSGLIKVDVDGGIFSSFLFQAINMGSLFLRAVDLNSAYLSHRGGHFV